jgi:hypothetical protein
MTKNKRKIDFQTKKEFSTKNNFIFHYNGKGLCKINSLTSFFFEGHCYLANLFLPAQPIFLYEKMTYNYLENWMTY